MEAVIDERAVPSLSPVFVILSGATMALLSVWMWQQNSRLAKLANQLPGPVALPFIGNGHLLLGKTQDELSRLAMKWFDMYGDVIRAWMGNESVIFLSHAADVERILSSNVHLKKSAEYDYFEPWLGDGLLINDGDKWSKHRKIIAPTFHQSILKTYMGKFNENANHLASRLQKTVGKEFDIHGLISETTVDILVETAMGTDRGTQHTNGEEYSQAVLKLSTILQNRQLKFWNRFDVIFNMSREKQRHDRLLDVVHSLSNGVIAYKRNLFNQDMKSGRQSGVMSGEKVAQVGDKTKKPVTTNGNSAYKSVPLRDDLDDIDDNDIGDKRRLAFLDGLLEKEYHNVLTKDEVREEVNTIMFEGHDTTASGMSFFLALMGIHKDVQEKVWEEQQAIFGNSNRDCTFTDTVEMKYLERVILETLRLYPPVPIIARKVEEDVQLSTLNKVIPAGAAVVIATFRIHRSKLFYPNPNVFNPDNFLPERMASRHYYSFIPFSAGPRSCVGRKFAMLKMKVVLSTLIRKYRMKSDLKESDFKLQGDIILKRVDGFPLTFEQRV